MSKKTKTYEYIIVGSGCSAAMTAQTLVEAGAEVVMIDVGMENPEYQHTVPAKDFVTIRRQEADQYRYFLGPQAEGVVWGDIGKGAQVTPTRAHMVRGVQEYLPLDSTTFSPIESLGYGGLGIGWGVQCWEFSDTDLTAAGLDKEEMRQAYETVSERIGISATKDDAAPYTMVHLKTHQPSPPMDRNHERIYQKYVAKRKKFHDKGFYLGRTPLALLTKDMGGRKKYQHRDMDFYDDNDQSAWRPWMTVNELRQKPNFTYIGGHLATHFIEKRGHVALTCITIPERQEVVFRSQKLILATGALGSARLVLRSQGSAGDRLPLLCNPYTYIPCIQPAMVGKGVEKGKMGFAQLSLFLDETHTHENISVASLYSYQSLMLFRLIRQAPFLNFRDARPIMQYLMSGLVIMGVHHPDRPSTEKYLCLQTDTASPTGDRLQAQYKLDEEARQEFRRREQKFIAAGRKLGIFAIKKLNPGYGSSVHYAGTLPFSQQEKPYTLTPQGKLHGTRRVYVADSSGFTYLPAKGLTFSLLANAHVIAGKVLRDA